jgi:hypothetical protein
VKVEAARKAAGAKDKSEEAIEIARCDLAIAEARHAALAAILKVEALEDAGRKDSPEWSEAATATAKAQRDLAAHEAHRAVLAALQARRAAPPAARAEMDKKVADADKARIKAKDAAQAPPTTAFARRTLKTYPTTSTGRRLAFARWIASRDNPLTARVAVNQIWLRHFGQAIVPSVNDFGRNGRPPSHPALLDWLAAEFMDRGWSMKALHRLIVTSASYRLDSTPDRPTLARDPDNTFVWRMSPRRLEAEAVRDCLFHVAGRLDPTMGGPDIDHNQGLTTPRRSVYFRHAAEKQMEFLKIFDGPSVTECYRRHESTMPQQALALSNSELTLRLAKTLAQALSDRAGSDPCAFTTSAFEQVLARPPTKDELVECVAFLEQQGRRDMPDAESRARESLIHVLMNHHDFVTIR